MFAKTLAVAALGFTLTTHAEGPGVACQTALAGQRLVVGAYPATWNGLALAAAGARFDQAPASTERTREGQEILVAARLADGAAMFLVEVDYRTGPQAHESQMFVVRVTPEGLATATPELTDVESEHLVADVALETARAKFAVGRAFPGPWEGNEGRITGTDLSLVMMTGPGQGVALVDVHGRHVTLEAVLHTAIEIRDGAVHGITELAPMAVHAEITESDVNARVRAHVLNQFPNADVRWVKSSAANFERTVFLVTVTENKGAFGPRATFYEVKIDADREMTVTATGAQG